MVTWDVVQVGEHVGRGVFEPAGAGGGGEPMRVQTRCQANHTASKSFSGRMGRGMDTGASSKSDRVYVEIITDGHDAWTAGDESCVAVDFTGSPLRKRCQGRPMV